MEVHDVCDVQKEGVLRCKGCLPVEVVKFKVQTQGKEWCSPRVHYLSITILFGREHNGLKGDTAVLKEHDGFWLLRSLDPPST